MNPRDPEVQTLRLIGLLKVWHQLPGSMLRKIDGIWYLVPAQKGSA